MLHRLLPVVFLFPLFVFAQDLGQRPLVVMNLAAHPDDEDGNTLSYYRHHEGAVSYSVIYTRGEGGQNEIGPELYERLGAIRTAETEAAARVLGTQVHFLNFYDFGYSKSADETFLEWSRDRRGFWDTDEPVTSVEEGRERVIARLVYLIRKLKPDILFTNHDTLTVGSDTQHGHHQAVGISAYEAFALAADPAFHPEQLEEEGVDLWQPKRLFLRQWRNPDNPDVAVPVGDPCPARPLQIAYDCTDLAVLAAGKHFSQGFDRFAPRFRADTTYFQLLRSADGTPPLSEGSLDLAAGIQLEEHQQDLTDNFLLDSMTRPARWRVESSSEVAVPGQEIRLHWTPVSRMPAGVTPSRNTFPIVEVVGPDGQSITRLNRENDGGHTVRLPGDLTPTLPKHRRQYDRFVNHPPLYYSGLTEGPLGYLDLEIAPPVIVDLDPAPVLLRHGQNELAVSVVTYDPAVTEIELRLAIVRVGGMTEQVYTDSQMLGPDETEAVFTFDLPLDLDPGRYRVAIGAEAHPTSAPAEPFVVTRQAAILPDVQVADGLRVGFVRSYDRVTENALRSMGANVTALDSTDLALGDLSRFDTIVLDIRAYLVRPDLREHNQRLLDWVREGGHLVAGYHKTFEWNPGQTGGFFDTDLVDVPESGWAPYPLRLGRDRVTREDAPVEHLLPDHVLFHAPHEIEPQDWDNWVQERGLYFPAEYDSRYAELLTMNDPGEDPLRGSLLLAEVGAGSYLYSSLGWYRQLEALNPGAWRMFANIVSFPLTNNR
ncbi:MAG: PIG-L family deacetylase [Rubricoccaceae bacterium]|nr:PIG-L family deacetylase [Rubricoccaceae bacterium]